MMEQLSSYVFGDMKAIYVWNPESRQVGLMLVPINQDILPFDRKRQQVDGLVQVKLIGDTYTGEYSGGMTLRQSESVNALKYVSQETMENGNTCEVRTLLKDDRGYEATHVLTWFEGSDALECYTIYENKSNSEISLELLSSFSLSGITPFVEGDAYGCLQVHRIRSAWSVEGQVETLPVEQMQLEPSWCGHGIRAERFGQTGSMPVSHFFPFLAVEDTKTKITWGAQIAHNASWQMELFRKDDGLAISGGLADREFGHWIKKLSAGEKIESPRAILSVCHGGLDRVSQRLTKAGEYRMKALPASEEELPVLFNEYCTTWGNPSHENITAIVEKIKNHGFSYFVIDCGWFKEKDISWDISMGDYEISSELFPGGLDKTVQVITDAGMLPGIWFEIDNVGRAAKAYREEEHLLKKDGYVLTTSARRFWDMRDPWVENYLSQKVIEMLKKYNFRYMKMDYNDSIGIGCDGAESIGEGLRQNMDASIAFIRKVKREIPDIILENCASGGHKLEPLTMGECAMASFSDAHECEEIPVIAAALHRVILPRQSQIWAVIRKTDSCKRIAYSCANTFLGRMCISGDVTELSKTQWEIIDRSIAFYKSIAPIIKNGTSYFFGTRQISWRHLTGWQGIVRIGEKDAYAVIHTFHGPLPQSIEIELPGQKAYEIKQVFSDTEVPVKIENRVLQYSSQEEMKAVAVLLCEKE